MLTAEMQKQARRFRLPETSTTEEIETRFYSDRATFVKFGNLFLMAGYFCNGSRENDYFGAVYEITYITEDGEEVIRLAKISGDFFTDNGHALAWAMGIEK